MERYETLLKLKHICSDPARANRTGIPEIVFAENKSLDQIIAAVQELVETNGKAIVSRLSHEHQLGLRSQFGDEMEIRPGSRTAVIRSKSCQKTEQVGKVGIITAGSSDIPIAEEAYTICSESGCEVVTAYDVGVAGIHRLTEPLSIMTQDPGCDVIIVSAGMDGALPSVVAGLVDLPVIGLPTSVGYGYGGAGVGALMSMLQSCAPGISVVNIDNGVGAASAAVKIARQVAKSRARAKI